MDALDEEIIFLKDKIAELTEQNEQLKHDVKTARVKAEKSLYKAKASIQAEAINNFIDYIQNEYSEDSVLSENFEWFRECVIDSAKGGEG